MEITRTLYVTNRKDWRAWLKKHHHKEKEIWLVYYRKNTGKPRISYNNAVEEALCYGWIDSTVKKVDEERFAQRYTPRNPKSPLSQMNKERVRMLVKKRKLTKTGLAASGDVTNETFTIPQDILKALKADKQAWKNFQKFPEHYQRIRTAYIQHGGIRTPEEFKKRLNHFLKKTSQNKKFGMVQ